MTRSRASGVRSIGLVQINSSFSGQHYFPYSVGVLQAYALKYVAEPARYRFLLPIYRRVHVEEAVDQLHGADIVCFSVYVWNVRLSLAIAEAVKRRHPGTLVVFGGPQVTYYVRTLVEGFLRAHPFVDVAIHGEGERPFVALLEAAEGKRWDAVPSASYITADGRFHQTKPVDRIRDLDEVPSPYLEGVFAPLVEANPGEKWIGLWETNRGCPFTCTFCGWGSAVNARVTKWSEDRLYKEIDWFADHKVEFVFCADANFGILPRDLAIAARVARTKQERGFPQRLAVQDTKNVKERAWEVRQILASADLNTGVVVSLQSVDPRTLAYIRRDNISLESFKEIGQRFTAEGIEFMTDLILGLPGETYDSFANGVSDIITRGQHHRIQFNILTDVPDAEMSSPEYRERHGLVTVESDIVNVHGALESDEIREKQLLIVASRSMPSDDWRRAWVLARTAALLHFDKLLQIPLIVCRELGQVSYRDLLELFTGEDLDDGVFPVLADIRRFLAAKARDIQAGDVEYCHAPDWLDIYWPADEYLFIRLVVEEKLAAFYQEAEKALAGRVHVPPTVLNDAVELNRALIKLPFQSEDATLECSSNVWEFYRGILVGQSVECREASHRYRVDRTSERWSTWDDWFRKVVWYGNKRGAYLYGNEPVSLDLAGHF